MVYEYVMGEETVHLTLSTKQKFGHFVCEGRDGGGGVEGGDERECDCRVLVGGRESERLSSACARMLRVCRRMYVFLTFSCPTTVFSILLYIIREVD